MECLPSRGFVSLGGGRSVRFLRFGICPSGESIVEIGDEGVGAAPMDRRCEARTPADYRADR